MYAVIVIFALALLSPLPFASPFPSVYAQLPFEEQQSFDSPTFDSPVETSAAFDGSVELIASQIAPDTIMIKANVGNVPSYAITANSSEIPFSFLNNVFQLNGTDNTGADITNANSESWFAQEYIEYSYIENGTKNLPLFVNLPNLLPVEEREVDLGLKFGDGMANLGDIDGDGVSDLAIGATGDGDDISIFYDVANDITTYQYNRKNQGALYILLMNDDGTIKSTIKHDSETENMPDLSNAILQPYDAEFGGAIVSLGDIHNDGTIVIAIGADYHSNLNPTDGAVYILHLGDGGSTILDSFIIQPESMGVTLPTLARFGASVENIGDVDNNGVPDLAVGAIGLRTITNATKVGGGVLILHMGENATSVLKVAATFESSLIPPDGNLSDTHHFQFITDQNRFGSAITLLDTYDDGTISLAMAASASGYATEDRIGSIHIVNLTNQATVVSSVTLLDYTTPNLVLNERNYDAYGVFGLSAAVNLGTFGSSMVNMGDLSGNGVNDILVGYPNLNSIGGAYILYMNSDNSVNHTAKFQIDRIEEQSGTIEILKDDQEQIDAFRKYFNYSNPPNMPTSVFQEHIDPRTAQLETTYFDLGTAAIDFGDVYNDGYTDIALSSIGHNHGTILVINRLGPAVNVTFDPIGWVWYNLIKLRMKQQ